MDLFLQLMVNGLVTGCLYALIALGFAFIYNTTKIFHIAHGAVYVAAVYLFYTFYRLMDIPVIASILITLPIIAVVGMLIDRMVHKPLDREKTSLLVHLLSSLGLYIVIVNLIAMFYGNETKVVFPGIQETYRFGGIIITEIQLLIVIVFVIVFGIILMLLHKTNLGKMIRAMRDDSELLSVLGINPYRIRLIVFSLGSILAGIAAILAGMDVGMDPHIGFSAVLNGAVAVIIGGIGFFEGAAAGGFIIGLLQSLIIWQTSARWEEAGTFLLLIIFLLWRPQGLFSSKKRAEEVVI